MSKQNELRKEITDRLIDAMKQGLVPWRKPWTGDESCGFPVNILSGKPYRGINPLLLGITSLERGYVSKYWGTYKQWSAKGAQVKKRPDNFEAGEWGTRIVFYSPIKKIVEKNGAKVEDKFFVLRTYTVFNLEQVEGESVDKYRPAPDNSTVLPDYSEVKNAIDATKAEIAYGGNKAFYVPPTPYDAWPNHTSGDHIRIPYQRQFKELREFYETLLHELSHWAEIRTGWKRDGSKSNYAKGELIAEIAACYLSSALNVPQSEDLQNHKNYLGSWLREMENDYNFIFQASTQASKVADYILSFSRTSETTEEFADAIDD